MNSQKENKLEKFVRKNRQDFDCFDMPQNLWGNIQNELSRQEKKKVIQIGYQTFWRMTAVVLLLVGGYVVYAHFYQNLSNADPLKQISPKMAETEAHYFKIIAQKQQQINQFPLKEMGVENDFKSTLGELEKEYTSLKKEFYKAPIRDKIKDAMVLNLKMRLEILNQQLEILQQIEKLRNDIDDLNNPQKHDKNVEI
jgi:hypothetical protein